MFPSSLLFLLGFVFVLLVSVVVVLCACFFIHFAIFLCIYVNGCLWGPEDGVRVPATFSCQTWVLGTQVMCKNNPSSYLLNNFSCPLVCLFGGFFFLFELWGGLTVLNLASSCIINFLARQRNGHF